MKRECYHRVREYCESNQLFHRGDKVAVGFSGGADSLFLVLLLMELGAEWDLELWLVHVHHGIRGEEADRDREFCEKFAREHRLPIRVFQGDVPRMARQQKCSLEEMARRYRYQCFQKMVQEQKMDKIAVAHHQDDQAETILFQMIRGSGLKGMGGMRGISGNLVRPLLPLRRQDILQALEELGQCWCEDGTNRELTCSRNRIRHQVMPLLEEYVNSAAAQHIARCGQQLQWIGQFMDQELETRLDSLDLAISPSGRITLSVKKFLELPKALQMQLLHRLLSAKAGQSRDIGWVHLEAVFSLAKGESGKRRDLPYGIQAGRDYDILWIDSQSREMVSEVAFLQGTGKCAKRKVSSPTGESCTSQEQGRPQEATSRYLWEQSRTVPLEIRVPAMDTGELHITLSRENYRESLSAAGGKIPKNICTKWFEYARINGTLEFRHPKTGDFLWLDEMGTRRKSLGRFMIDSHIPREQRKRLWVLAQEDSVLWIPELGRQSAAYYVTPETEEILCVVLVY